VIKALSEVNRSAGRTVPPTIDRTSANDMVSLTSGMQVGAVIVLERDPGDVESLLSDRIRTVPRLRRRLVRTPFGCGRPVWVDDPGFDITKHVGKVVCPAPGNEAALLDIASSLVIRPLSRSSPLWSTGHPIPRARPFPLPRLPVVNSRRTPGRPG
jgi:hypothetical protein